MQVAKRETIYLVIKWIFVIVALLFLIYKLVTFEHYDEFLNQWKQMPLVRLGWLLVACLLLPLNFAIESFKWKKMMHNVQHLCFTQALKGVLSGVVTGFFSPNRLGDMVGRSINLNPGNKIPGAALSLLNGLTQTIVIVSCGIPACILFFLYRGNVAVDVGLYALCSFFLLAALCAIYFLLPSIGKLDYVARRKKLNDFVDFISRYSKKELLSFVFYAFCRYLVFSFQFYCMLCFFDVCIPLPQVLFIIPTYYLFVTLTPSIAFSDVVIRTSYAMLFIGSVSYNSVAVALAAMAIWIVNWVIPLLIGVVALLRSGRE